MTASTAAVPEPAKSTAVKSDPAPASATRRSRQRRTISKHSGSRWQRSSMTSAWRTVAVVLAGPGLSKIHMRRVRVYPNLVRWLRTHRGGTMEFGVFTEFSRQPAASESTAFDEAMAEVAEAEA